MSTVDHTHNIIEIKNVSFAYGKAKVLKEITLNIHKGDYLGIIGPNGGGKTTLVKLILGLLKLDEGSIKLFGKDISKFKDWYKVGYVAQKNKIDTNFPATVREVVEMGRISKRGLFKWLTAEDRKVAQKALDYVDVSNYQDSLITELSGGQQQRVFIARALANESEILFLDEPTTGVDAKSQDIFYKLLKKLNRELGMTIVVISHDIDFIAKEATEIACVNYKITYHGVPEKAFEKENLDTLYGDDVKFIFHRH